MNDEKLIKEAWGIYKEVIAGIKFKDGITWKEDKNGEVIITYKYKVNSEYNSEELITVTFCPPIETIVDILVLRDSKFEDDEIDIVKDNPLHSNFDKISWHFFDKLANDFALILVLSFSDELDFTFERMMDLPILMLKNLEGHANSGKRILAKSFLGNPEFEAQKSKIIKHRQNRTKETFEKRIDVFKKLVNDESHIIGFFYNSLHPLWEDVKNFYKKLPPSTKWKELIRTEFEFVLPIHLIERLAEQDKYLSAPAHLAREHAAYLCKYPQKSHKTLEREIKKNIDWIEKNTDVANTKIKSRFNLAFELIEFAKEITGEPKNVDSLNLPPFERFLFENSINSYEDWKSRLNFTHKPRH